MCVVRRDWSTPERERERENEKEFSTYCTYTPVRFTSQINKNKNDYPFADSVPFRYIFLLAYPKIASVCNLDLYSSAAC